MASRTQIDRISRTVDRIASALKPPVVSYVPIYQNETEADALAAYREELGIEPNPARLIFNRGRPGETRAASMASGMHHLYRLGPSDVRVLLARVDGKTRGIPRKVAVAAGIGNLRSASH
jgi:hypothetical protein